MAELGPSITAADTEQSIAERAVTILKQRGISETWYYDCPAYVLLGSRSCSSRSGREYVPSMEPVWDTNLVTVDLSPVVSNAWGDCARSFVIESSCYISEPQAPEFSRGLDFELKLHREMREFVTADTTFEKLFRFSNVRAPGGV